MSNTTTTIDDGGPAFPEAGLSGLPNDQFVYGRAGMSLRDYFIAHAPTEPQDWFQPVMPSGKQSPPPKIPDPTPEERHELSGLDEYIGTDNCRCPRVKAYSKARDEFNKLERKWNAEASKQRYVQWPAAWADEMLRARKQGGAV